MAGSDVLDAAASADDVTLPDPTSPEFDVADEGDEPEGDDAPDTTDGTAAVVEAPPEPEPEPVDFAIDIDGQMVPIPGAKFLEKARRLELVDEKALQRMQTMLRHGHNWEAKGRDAERRLKAQLRDVEQAKAAEVESANVFADEFAKMVDPNLPDDQAVQMFLAVRGNWPLIQAKAETARAHALLAKSQQPAEPDEPSHEELTEFGVNTVSAWLEEMSPSVPWLTADVRKELRRVVTHPRNLGQLVRKATQDMPHLKVRAGQWYVDPVLFDEICEPIATPYQRAHEAQAATVTKVQAIESVAKTNATILGRAKPAAPVTPAPARRTPPRSDPERDARAKLRSTLAEADREFLGR